MRHIPKILSPVSVHALRPIVLPLEIGAVRCLVSVGVESDYIKGRIPSLKFTDGVRVIKKMFNRCTQLRLT
jgi:hypothetical protein